MKKRFTDEQIIGILREAEVGAMSIKALCKKHNLTEQAFFRLFAKCGWNRARGQPSSPESDSSTKVGMCGPYST